METQELRPKPIDLLNNCRTCLKEISNSKTSIFSYIDIGITDRKRNPDDDSCFRIRVVDIILYCAAKISVNIPKILKIFVIASIIFID